MMTKSYRKSVLVFIPYYLPAFRGGGPIRTIEGLTNEHKETFDFYIFCGNHDLGETTPLPVPVSEWTDTGSAQVYYADTSTKIQFVKDLASLRRMDFDFLYFNSYFSFAFSILPALMAKVGLIHGRRAVIAPRGEFGNGALAIRSTKKQLFLAAAKLTRVHKDLIWHGSSAVEAEEIQRLFPNSKVVVRENETSLPLNATINHWEPQTGPVKFIYVGRLSPKKRIELVLQALSKVELECILDIYGEFEDQTYEQSVRSILEILPKNVTVKFHGSLENRLVRSRFSAADYFLFPTSHENFGHTIAESMSVGCPLVIQDVTPFTKSIEDGKGFIVGDSSIRSWADAIVEVASRTPTENRTARTATAAAYDAWRDASKQPSVFEHVERLPLGNELGER